MTDTQTADTPAETTPEVDALTAYKAQVRAKALELKRRFDWCREETNQHLEALGLEPLPAPKQYTFEATTTGVVRYVAVAHSEEEARAEVERVHAADVRRSTSRSYDRGPRNGSLESLTYNDGGPKLREISGRSED